MTDPTPSQVFAYTFNKIMAKAGKTTPVMDRSHSLDGFSTADLMQANLNTAKGLPALQPPKAASTPKVTKVAAPKLTALERSAKTPGSPINPASRNLSKVTSNTFGTPSSSMKNVSPDLTDEQRNEFLGNARAALANQKNQNETIFQKAVKLASHPLEIANRPFASAFGGATSVTNDIAQALKGGTTSGTFGDPNNPLTGTLSPNFGDFVKHLGTALKKGITGDEHKGGGDLIQALKKVDRAVGDTLGTPGKIAEAALTMGSSLPVQESNIIQDAEKKYAPNGVHLGFLTKLSDMLKQIPGIDNPIAQAAGLAPAKLLQITAHNVGKNTQHISPWVDRILGGMYDYAGFEANPVRFGKIVQNIETGAKGEEAFSSAVKKAVDDAASIHPELNGLNSQADLNLLKRMNLLRHHDEMGNLGAPMSAADFVKEYEAVTPNSKVIKDFKAGKITEQEAYNRIIANRPTELAPGLKTDLENYNKGAITSENLADNFAQQAPNHPISINYTNGTITAEEAANKIAVADHGVDYQKLFESAFKLRRDVLEDAIKDAVDKQVTFIKNGAASGRLAGGGSIQHALGTVTEDVAETLRNYRMKSLEDFFKDRFAPAALSGKGNLAKLRPYLSKLPYGDEFWKEFDNAVRNGKSVNEALKTGMEEAYKAAAPEFETFKQMARDHLDGAIKDMPTLRIWEHEKSLPKVGKALQAVGEKWRGTPFGHGLTEMFSYTGKVPGEVNAMRAHSYRMGVKAFEDFKNEATQFFKEKGFNKAELKALQHNYDLGIRGTGKMAEGYDYLDQAYQAMEAEKRAAGAQSIGYNVPNYSHVQITPGGRKNWKDVQDWYKAREDALAKNGSTAGFTAADAKAAGFRTNENSLENLLYHRMRTSQKLAPQYFYKDVVQNFGVDASNMSKAEAASHGLVPVNASKLDWIMEGKPIEDYKHIYLHKDINDVVQHYYDLMEPGSESSKSLVRTLDWLNTKFKMANTIYFPGYHFRNFIGDMFLGQLDGIGLHDYKTVFGALQNKDTALVRLGDRQVPFQKILQEFDERVALSGFYDVDLQSIKPSHFARKTSKHIQDFGRLVHFYGAMDEEYAAFLRKGMKADKAWEQAVKASVARVDKFKFDYNALTSFEKNVMRRGIPFYTFMRKAMPVMMESMLTKPEFLLRLNKLQMSLADRLDDYPMLPDWIRQAGYGKIFGDYAIPSFFETPSSYVQQFTGDPIGEITRSLTPVLQVPFEARTGVDTYTGQKIPGNNTWERLLPAIEGKFKGVGMAQFLQSDSKDMVEKIGKIIGQPIRKINTQGTPRIDGKSVSTPGNEVDQAQKETLQAIDENVKALDNQMATKGFHVYKSFGKKSMLYVVKNLLSNKIVFTSPNINELWNYTKTL